MRTSAVAFTLALMRAAYAQEGVQTSVWFDAVDARSRTDVLQYRKGPVEINVILYPRDHTADGGVAVSGSWVDCGTSEAVLVDQSGNREALTGGCPPQAQGIGIYNASHKSTTLGHMLAHASRLELVVGATTIPIDLTGLRGAFSRAAAYQQTAPEAPLSNGSSSSLPPP